MIKEQKETYQKMIEKQKELNEKSLNELKAFLNSNLFNSTNLPVLLIAKEIKK